MKFSLGSSNFLKEISNLSQVRGRGGGRECQAGTTQEQPRGATPHPRSGTAAERSYPTFKVRRGGCEEIPLVQGKRNPNKMGGVARGHQRADTLKP